ncbi:MAG: hypothetical protein QGG42_07730 [Phycisphaerae bacterium]|jgi:hypothetical protein|nr:hypothetical protein [Phycisphaerae bacterium]
MRNLAFVTSLMATLFIITPHAVGATVTPTASLATPDVQEDYPAMCVDKQGRPCVIYVAWDDKADSLKLARLEDGKLKVIATPAGPGIIHQPAVACDAKGAIWAIWSQINEQTNAWSLNARRIVGDKPDAQTVTVEGKSGSAVFCDAGSDAKGRIWITWQSFRKAHADIFAKYYDPAADKWSDEIQVTKNPAGDWEPRLAFGKDDGAWIAFDSSRGGVYNVYLAKVALDGKTEIKQLTKSPRYQGRPSIAVTPDGKSFVIACENGRLNWGGDTRGVAGSTGLNFGKHLNAVQYDIATGKITPIPGLSISLRIGPKPQPTAKAKPKAKKPKRKPQGRKISVLNMPRVMIDSQGRTWVSARRYIGTSWKLALTRYDAKTGKWSAAVPVAKSPFGQDRRCAWARNPKGEMYMAWPSDLRRNKHPLTAGVYLAKIDTSMELAAGKAHVKPKRPAPKAIWGEDTPQRARSDRHVWEIDGKKYKLYWGDFHRHTDMSACRTPDDGCVVEQFRYAYDIGKLDFLGTSDHTDIANMYGPYEWWHNQKLMDVFHAPGIFNSFYVYEREQTWPWGHRNVVFIKRGGPMIYIKRALYKNSIWGKMIPPAEGPAQIAPKELWKLLRAWKYEVSVVSHTGATGMGTDWDGYEKIDNAVENLVEIYQGARVSYEGINTPQPTVGFPKDVKLKADAHGSVKTGKDFGRYNKGVYQNALKNGYKLGIFTSSDHIATNTSFGGVYVEEFTRKAVLDAMNARRTIAGTDKVFIEFSCNGHLLGTVFETSDKPKLKIAVSGTAPLSQVTIVRNEKDLKTFEPKTKEFDTVFTDQSPIEGENRYYIRVVQSDGNMAWATPVWATFKKK